jgi:outer membrane protein OmpA-like peptidoglycan-associated protein
VYIYPSGKEVQVESQEEDPPATTVQVPGTTTVVPVYTHRVDTVYLYETGQQVQKEVQGDTRETTTTQTTEAASVATVVTPSMASDSRTEPSSTTQESATTREDRRSVESQQATEAYTARISPAEHVSPSVASNVSARPAKVVTGIPFDFDEEKLNLAAMLEVEKLLDLMNNFPDITIDLEGHTDDIGPSEYNKQLSYRRAKMVSDYLTDRGIDSKRISVSGKGETQPHAINIQADGSDSPIGRFLNRQVTATISGLNSSMNELNMFYVPLSLRPGSNMRSTVAASNGYTIQVLALTKPVRKGYFNDLEGIKEHMSGDGFYRYTYGKYASYKEAKQHLFVLKKSGYSDAFVQPCARYSR